MSLILKLCDLMGGSPGFFDAGRFRLGSATIVSLTAVKGVPFTAFA
jgi:hypothetical protein